MALPVTVDLVERAAARLGDGGWRFSLRQLYYAACADAEIPPNHATSNGEIAVGALLVLVALILIRFPIVFVALLGVAAVLILLGLLQRFTARPPSGRVLAMSYSDFAERFGALTLTGLIDPGFRLAPAGPHQRLVVCDTAENAALVAANREVAGLDVAVLASADSLPALDATATIATLHDASPRGCALPLEVHDVGVAVIDCGLRPGWVDAGRFQALEGAPARLPRDLQMLLDGDEIGWLASGRRVELATLSPDRLMALLEAALEGGAERLPGVRVFEPGASTATAVLSPS